MHSKNTNEKEEIKILKNLLRTTDNKRMNIRYQVITLHLRNYTNTHISKIMELNPHTVGTYINSYKKDGSNGLAIGKPTGCPRFLTTEQEEKL
jgi:transposase